MLAGTLLMYSKCQTTVEFTMRLLSYYRHAESHNVYSNQKVSKVELSKCQDLFTHQGTPPARL
jgi:hypothetical protein